MAFTKYAGVYPAIVIDISDPAGLDRIKVRIPQIHGFMEKETYGPISQTTIDNSWVDSNNLPWAAVCYPFGSTSQPEVNQVVWVSFVNGNINYPVIMGWAGYDYTDQEEILEAP